MPWGRALRRLPTGACVLALAAFTSGASAQTDTDAGVRHPALTIGPLRVEAVGRIQGEIRGATPVIGLDDQQFDWRDRRFGVQGAIGKRVEFEVSREFGEDLEPDVDTRQKTPWRDVYVDVRVFHALRFQAGRFKLPFGREELTSEANLDFTERSLSARVISPGRDPGVMLHGRFAGRMLEYQAGYFTRDGVNGRTSQTDGGRDAMAGRIVVAPLSKVRGSPGDLSIGAAIARSELDHRLGIRGRTAFGDGIFFDRVYVNGRRDRVGLDARYAIGPVAVSAERVSLSDERREMGYAGDDLPSADAHAWSVSGSWVLTGERKRPRIVPHRALFRGGAGAVEAVVRIESLSFASVTYPTSSFGFVDASTLSGNSDRVVAFGVNWYPNAYVKLQADFAKEAVADAARSPAPSSSGRFTTFVLRLQIRM